MRNQEPIRPLPAAVLADANGYTHGILENRLKRQYPLYFRTRSGVLVRVSWSKRFNEFKITNAITVATTYTAKAAFRFVVMLNEMSEQIEVAA